MCRVNFLKEMKQRRGYAEMRMLFRRSNVNFSCKGEQFLEIAVMSYLENPALTQKELMLIAEENAPMQFANGISMYSLMLESLQNVYTHKSRKLDDEGAVMLYISSIANEIRINAMLEMKESEEGIDPSVEERDVMTSICKRRMLKPKDTFKEVLNHVAGRSEFEDIEDMLGKLTKYVKISEKITLESAIANMADFVDEVLKEKDSLVF